MHAIVVGEVQKETKKTSNFMQRDAAFYICSKRLGRKRNLEEYDMEKINPTQNPRKLA